MASISTRTGRTGVTTWRVQFRIDGRMCQETFSDPVAAEEFGRNVDTMGGAMARRVLNARNSSGAASPTLRTWTAQYLDPASGILTGITDGTRKDYVRIAERSFLPVLGDYPVDAISKTEVGRWVALQEKETNHAKTGTLSPKTIRNYHALLSSVMAAAVDAGLIPSNPAHKTRLTKGRQSESVFLTASEFITLLHFIPDYYQGFVLFLAGTGARWGEATAVTWGDVNLKASPPTVRIDKAWKKGASAPVLGPPKSPRANRTISLTADVVEALGGRGLPAALLFPGRISGKHLWYGRFHDSVWVPAVEKARDEELCATEGLEPLHKVPTPHDLRHSHASWLIARGVPLPLIQARLGHESIQTTVNVYGHLQPDAHMVMADVMTDTLAGVRPLRQIVS